MRLARLGRLGKKDCIGAACLLLLVSLSSCTAPAKKAEGYAVNGDWLKSVREYRRLVNENPSDIEYRSSLLQIELKAADYYYQRGKKYMDQGSLEDALIEFQQGLRAMERHEKLQQVMQELLLRKESEQRYDDALRNRDAGKYQEAIRLLEAAIEIYPDHSQAESVLHALRLQLEASDEQKLVLTSSEPITLNFRETGLRAAFEFITKAFGLNIIFDEEVGEDDISLYAKDVSFSQAINLLLTTSRTFYKKIGPNTILVSADTKNKRAQYEDHIIRVYHVRTIKAKAMAEILKAVLSLKKVIINEQLNTLVIRDTQEILTLAQQLIDANDIKPAELILDVEILEVNRNKAEKLGLDFGEQVSLKFSEFGVSDSFRDAVKAGRITLPAVTFRYFKQDVDAKTLANPKIRVLNGKSAKIHIGDRVPLRSSTIVDATGQTRTTFEYKDIGIRLHVEPDIHLDNSVTVKLLLEVSTLGPNLGSDTEAAFSIGTRNAETFMSLRDGETAILGGLIRDEERSTRVRVPGLGDIPLIGPSLFTSYDDSSNRTDVLLTITPRIVRSWELTPAQLRNIYSGTANTFATKPRFGFLDKKTSNNKLPKISMDAASTAAAAVKTGLAPALIAPRAAPIVDSNAPILSFSAPVYEAIAGQELVIELLGEKLSKQSELKLQLLSDPKIMQFVRAESGSVLAESISAENDLEKGILQLGMKFSSEGGLESSQVLARIVMQANQAGVSYLLYRIADNSAGVQLKAARVLVK